MEHALQPGDGITHYRIVSAMGAGGMGEVYLAQDLTLERSVALKVLPPRLVKNDERLRRFVIEAKAASSLNHPAIVTVHEIGQGAIERDGASGETIHYIAMERIDGHTLGELIHEEHEDLKRLLGYLAQAADGIAKAHAAGIVHRDLKPGNIMVSKDGFAKVLDFGLAKLSESRAAEDGASVAPTRSGTQTSAGTVMGTVGYMSPEQVQGKAVDHRSDIFSFGCILYEAVTRRRAFEADSDVDTMHKILHDAPVETHELNPAAPTDLRRLVRRCLAKSPDQRLQSMKDLAIELREIADGYDALSHSASSGSGASAVGAVAPQAPRRPTFAYAIAGFAVIAALAAGGYAVFGHKAASSGPSSVATADMKMSVLMSRGDLDEFVLSADGRYLAYATTEAGKSSLNIRQVKTGGDVRIVPPQEFKVHGISFSPDGEYVYYLNQDPETPAYSALFQVPSLGGSSPRKVFFDIDTAAGWSPDGARACFKRGFPQDQADTLIIGDPATGTGRELVRVTFPTQIVTAPAWSPDGKRIAVGMLGAEKQNRMSLHVIDVDGGKKEPIAATPFSFLLLDSVAWLPRGDALIVTAFAAGEHVPQIFRIAYPGGETRRLTNDLSGYSGLSLAASGRSIAAMRQTAVSNVWIAPADGAKDAHALTFASGASGSSYGPTSIPGGVAFTVDESERGSLWRTAEDGSDRRQIVASGRRNLRPQYAERAGIVFTQVSEGDFVDHVWRVDPDGSGLRQLTSGAGETHVHVARDGRTVLLARDDAPAKLLSIDPIAGGEPKLLTASSTGDFAAVSPDGRLVRYYEFVTIDGRARVRIVMIPSGGGDPVAKFLPPPGIGDLSWSPDSSSLTYTDRNKGWNVMRQPVAGGEPTQLTRFTEGITGGVIWSRDGTRLGVIRQIGPKTGLWSLQPGKGEPKRLVEFTSGEITGLTGTLDSKSFLFSYATSSKDVVLISDFQ